MLTMINLSKIYRTEFLETFALRDFSIDVKEGEFVAITGPSGSGKTTFLNIAGILEEFTTGEYLLDGVNVRNMNDDQRSRLRNEKIGFIFQAFNLILDLSVSANVELPLHYRRITAAQRKARVSDALRRVGLSARSKHFPGELSGGQQQRVAIARALAGNPRILLADEPTGNLDSQTARGVMGLIEDLHRQGGTIVLVTHDPQIAARAQRQIHIVDGQIVALEQLSRTGLSQIAATIATDPNIDLNPRPASG
jgi:putative ABC transport system ATP-binding protein